MVKKDNYCHGTSPMRWRLSGMADQEEESQHSLSRGAVLSGGSGIVVLSSSLHILHMNRQAIKLAAMLGSAGHRVQEVNYPLGVLIQPLIELAGTILDGLRRSHETTDTGRSELSHAVDNLGQRVLIRGIGVPSANGLQDWRIVLLLSEISVDSGDTNRVPSL
jgi:hypothetical protein